MRIESTVFAALAIADVAVPASADVVVSTLGNSSSGGNHIGNSTWGAEFITGDTAQDLANAQAVIEGASSQVNAYLYSDAAGLPDIELFAFDSVATSSGTPQTVTFNASSLFTLEANTTYHLVINTTGSSTVFWRNSGSHSSPEGTGSTVAGQEIFGGGSWSHFFSTGSALYAINTVPAPGGAAVLAFAGVVAARRRR